ncbi:hypothetical protein G7Z17_g6485 [Cylindrodendrum hubeiense]|uniref:Major facilitator superfamily (MFS) profile domain-containing protein n=1 Tax=Cylindrodendrum hubeiense TaxID=595255 RepID=A0A9P5LF48_9HYPO|nr:hypothetical protein G7Z17_g6485 [Cylindrodendrum hubeiense]
MEHDTFPPGTVRIEDADGTTLVLAPQPSSDPNEPLNWSARRKTIHMILLSLYAIMVFAILCVIVPLYQDVNEELGISYDQLNNGYATNMAALSVGCIIFIPIALCIGRRPVYIVTAIAMFISAIWQAKMQTMGEMIAANAISGVAGAVNEALFQITVSDLFFVYQRGTMTGIYIFMVIVGNYLGPVAAGHAAVTMGWRWAFWLCAIFMGVLVVLMVFLLEETKYVPPPLTGYEICEESHIRDFDKPKNMEKASPHQPIPKETDSTQNQPRRVVEIDNTVPMKSYWERHALFTLSDEVEGRSFWRQLYQPFQILVAFPAVMFAALQYGFAIAMLAILAVTQSVLYTLPPYNFTTAGIGNMNLPPAIGALLGSIFGGPLVDYFIMQVAKRRGGVYEPETRLWLFLVPSLSMVIGSLVYGLTISKGMPWIINAVGAGFIGFAIGGTGDMALTYVQDSYQLILGNALTGVIFVRNILATALVFAISPWMEGMGIYDISRSMQ